MAGGEKDSKRRKISSEVLRLRQEMDLESMEAAGGRGSQAKDQFSTRYFSAQYPYPNQCCGSGIRCLFDPWIREIRDEHPRSYFLELISNFSVIYLNSLMWIRIRYPESFWPGIRDEKYSDLVPCPGLTSRIRNTVPNHQQVGANVSE